MLEQIKERESQRFGRTPPPLWDAIRPRLIGGLQIIAGAGMMKLGMLVASVNPYIGSGLFVLGYQYVGTGAVNIKDGTEKQPWLIDRAKQGAATVGLPPEIVDTMELLLSIGGAQLAAGAGALGTTKPLLPGTPPAVKVPAEARKQSAKDILEGLPGKSGKTGPIKLVPDQKALEDLFNKLSQGGKTMNPGTYPGVVKRLPDGTIIRMRDWSKMTHDATIDITLPNGRRIKVHIQP